MSAHEDFYYGTLSFLWLLLLLSPLASPEAVFREFLFPPHCEPLHSCTTRQPPGPVSAGATETGEPGFLTGVLVGPLELSTGDDKPPLTMRSPTLRRESW